MGVQTGLTAIDFFQVPVNSLCCIFAKCLGYCYLETRNSLLVKIYYYHIDKMIPLSLSLSPHGRRFGDPDSRIDWLDSNTLSWRTGQSQYPLPWLDPSEHSRSPVQ